MRAAPSRLEEQPGAENLAGLVERVTFHNPHNGFCVLRLKARGHRDLVTVVGHAALISAGEFVQATGSWSTINHRGRGVGNSSKSSANRARTSNSTR